MDYKTQVLRVQRRTIKMLLVYPSVKRDELLAQTREEFRRHRNESNERKRERLLRDAKAQLHHYRVMQEKMNQLHNSKETVFFAIGAHNPTKEDDFMMESEQYQETKNKFNTKDLIM